jgi:glutaminase
LPSARQPNPVERYLAELHERFRALDDGAVATYIPELGKADPRWFGICVATIDGHVYEAGETRRPFTLQSISKPFVYGLALEDRGKAAVLERIGVEPTGEAFNEISLEPGTGRPRNPMINAGAIAAASLVAGHSIEDRWNRMLALFALYAGRPVELNDSVYRSERETGHRNRAISHMLRNAGILTGDAERDLDLYFRQCSIHVTTRDLAIMAATLAGGGVNPVTRERALVASNVDEVLSVMTSCGMYDYAGEWLFQVGFPAKSGVSGGLLAVLPGQFGIGVFSPPLDARGNSVRGVAVCRALSNELGLHSLNAPRIALSVLRARFDLRARSSRRGRSEAERKLLVEHGQQAVIYRLQGDLSFAGMELVARKLGSEPAETRLCVFDLVSVREIDAPAARILRELLIGGVGVGREFALVGLARHAQLERRLGEAVANGSLPRLAQYAELDAALEWCENRLLGAHGAASADAPELSLAEHELLGGLDAEQLRCVAQLAERREFAPRQFVVREGDPANELFLLVRGGLSVLASGPNGELRRLATLSPGMTFGETALVERGARSAFVRADSVAVCWVLPCAALESASRARPGLMIALLGNVLRSSLQIVSRLSRELAAGAL